MKIGFIGAGNMATTMMGGMIASKLIPPHDIFASAKSDATLGEVKEKFGVHVTKDSAEVTRRSDVVFIAVVPGLYATILEQIKHELTNDKIVVTIAAGKSLNDVERIIGTDKKIVRSMPNTPALVNAGMSALCPNVQVTQDDLEKVKTLFRSFGECEVVDESLIDAVIGASGSSPAYIFMLIEAMADCAVSYGMSREQAYTFVAQAVLGSAKMVLETGEHPGALKDNVCSPGGATIEAVKTLEEEGFRKAIIKGMSAAIEKSKVMGES
ncbi:MAG: pyrroline-5-carboxylate reductase [Bacilli bacterium]